MSLNNHLQRILCNLLSNADKYGQPPIRLDAAICGESVEVRVCDAGEGPPDEFVSSMFEPFTRAERSRVKPGTGLGLSIVKGLAEANQGSVRYERDTRQGACFAVAIPWSSP